MNVNIIYRIYIWAIFFLISQRGTDEKIDPNPRTLIIETNEEDRTEYSNKWVIIINLIHKIGLYGDVGVIKI